MDYIYRCLGDLDPSFLLTHVFMRSLTGAVRDALAYLKTHDLETLDEEADRLIALPKKSPMAIFSTQLPMDDSEGMDAEEETDLPVMRLEQCHPGWNQRCSFQPQDSHPTRQHSPEYCYYHRRFGQSTCQCHPPCAWHPGNLPAAPRHCWALWGLLTCYWKSWTTALTPCFSLTPELKSQLSPSAHALHPHLPWRIHPFCDQQMACPSTPSDVSASYCTSVPITSQLTFSVWRLNGQS